MIADAAALGALQVNFTGGEPLVRSDLETLVGEARRRELYVNLITSGIPADADRLAKLAAAGLASVQLSIQDTDARGAAWIAGRDDMAAKMATAEAARALGLPLTLNVVLHRGNIERVGDFVALAERLGAERLELANTQYLGLGAGQSRGAVAIEGRAFGGARDGASRARPVARSDGDSVRARRLLWGPPARLHGRLGSPLRGDHARRAGLALPSGALDHQPAV